MTKYDNLSLYIFVAMLLAFGVMSCEDYTEDYPVPPASTVADFSYTSATGQVMPDTIQFLNSSIVPENAGTPSYEWSFGDGTTSTEENPQHIFEEVGLYTVKMMLTTSTGEVDSAKTIIKINEPFVDIYTQYFNPADTTGGLTAMGWELIDNDGDGNNWWIDYYESEVYVVSESWDGNAALTPENYLITPEIDLTDKSSVKLRYFVASASSGDYYAEHYKVVVSTDGTAVGNFPDDNVLYEETLPDVAIDGNWQEREVDLSAFTGQTVNIAWVHYNCTDQYKLMLDSIKVYEVLGN